jgi:hypothetical protein
MPTYTNSANMTLPIPIPGTTPGPDYATDLNSCLTLIDSHDHSLGQGVQITPAGLNINTDLSIGNNDLTDLQSIVFTNQTNVDTLQALYVATGSEVPTTNDLWYNDGNGNKIQITSGGTVNASIASLPGESYAAGTFTWKQGAGSTTPANFDVGSVTIRPNTAATANGVVLSPPAGIASQYTLTLPLLPASTRFMQLDNSGNITASIAVSGGLTTSNISPTAGILGSQLSASAGIIGGQLAANTVDGSNIVIGGIDGRDGSSGGNIADGSITGAAIHSRTVTPANMTSGSYNGLNTYAGGTVSSTTATLFTGSVAFTASGARPVFFSFYNTAANAGSVSIAQGSTLTITIAYNGSTIHQATVTNHNPGGGGAIELPMSAFSTLWIPGSGTSSFVYTVSATTVGSATFTANRLSVVQV